MTWLNAENTHINKKEEIKNHVFGDTELAMLRIVGGRLELSVGTADYVEIHRADAIAIAKHFNLVRSDL